LIGRSGLHSGRWRAVARADLLATMRLFNQALGVPCNYCHVQEGDGGRNDMASDEKAPKKTARVMMRMMAHVNDTLPSDLGRAATDVTRVQCITCHRESAIPKIPDPPPAPQRGGQPPA
jgi:Photosynthetic reaction centre cytochrome C subunit